MLTYPGYGDNPQFEELKKALADITTVYNPFHEIVVTMVQVLREKLRVSLIEMGPMLFNRSHCTYSIAFAVRETACVFGMDCVYETRGRLDGVIQTAIENPQAYLLAEWEWDNEDIFDAKNELYKLWHGTLEHEGASALLITYCEGRKYFEFARKVVTWWQKENKQQNEAELYLLTITHKIEGYNRTFQNMSTLRIGAKGVEMWDDIMPEEE